MKIRFASTAWSLCCLLGFATSPARSASILTENFDSLGAATVAGWMVQNLSNPLGATQWFQGNAANFDAHSGAPTSYAATNFENTDPAGGIISDWLLTPVVSLNNGLVLTFYTRTEAGSPFPDRLQVRLSTNGSGTNVGGNQATVGDFTTLLLDINPTFSNGGYPESWALQSVTLSGLGGPVNGRIAFRYFIDDTTVHGNYIGIDTFHLGDAVPEPSTLVLTGTLTGTMLVAAALLRRRKGVSL